MPTPPLDARNLLQRARALLRVEEVFPNLPGAVIPLAEFFAREVDSRKQRDKKILRMRQETALAVWPRERGKRGKREDVLSQALWRDNLDVLLADAASLYPAAPAPPQSSGVSWGVAEEMENVRETAAGKRADFDRAAAAFCSAIAEHGRGLRCQELADAFEGLGKDSPLRLLFEAAPAVQEKEDVVDQAIQLLGECYAHLTVKRSLYAIDPIQRLELIRREIPELNDAEFHGKMLDIFKELHDPHTGYTLPSPFKNRYAFLPFLIEDCGAPPDRKFVVTSVIPEFYRLTAVVFGRQPTAESCAGFGRGAEILFWNGAPMERAVWRNADREAGSNAAARFARGLAKMTVRSLSHSLPPEENWVTVTFVPKGAGDGREEQREIIIPWAIWEGRRADLLRHRERRRSDSVNEQMTEMHAMRKTLFKHRSAGEASGAAQPAPGAAETAGPDLSRVSRLPELIEFAHAGNSSPSASPVEGLLDKLAAESGKRFGYLRIRSFDADVKFLPEVFFREMLRIVDDVMEPFAPDGLMIDVRGNSGGIVKNGEKILQLFTPFRIEPACFHYRSTELLRDAAKHPRANLDLGRRQALAEAGDSLERALFGGSEFSKGFVQTDPAEANDIGQRYSGPVALIVDAMCYSATDIFVAGFKDNQVAARTSAGKDLIIGTDENIGAGGACRWTHDDDLMLLGEPFAPLPPGYAMTVAIQRSSRVGSNRGTPLEDFGVVPDFIQPLTKEDLLNGNTDLIGFVAGLLAQSPRYHVGFEPLGLAKQDGEEFLALRVRTQAVRRIECLVNGVLRLIKPVGDGEIEIAVPLEKDFPETFELQGFAKLQGKSAYELKAVRRRGLSAADRRPFRGELAAGAGA